VIVLKRDVGFPLHELPLRAGLAAALAVEIASGVSVEIKWPNDLMVADRKLGGILCEAGGDALLVGIGVNLLQRSFPSEIESTACSLLQASGRAVDASILLSTFLGQLRESLHDDAWRGRLLDRFMARGRHVRVELLGSGGVVEGTIAGLDDRGRLILQANDGRQILIEQGEIVTGPL
jgi:BirA family biotin operon repressor/biotin-[acetyl-CoA-carboxylase] ligase